MQDTVDLTASRAGCKSAFAMLTAVLLGRKQAPLARMLGCCIACKGLAGGFSLLQHSPCLI